MLNYVNFMGEIAEWYKINKNVKHKASLSESYR